VRAYHALAARDAVARRVDRRGPPRRGGLGRHAVVDERGFEARAQQLDEQRPRDRPAFGDSLGAGQERGEPERQLLIRGRVGARRRARRRVGARARKVAVARDSARQRAGERRLGRGEHGPPCGRRSDEGEFRPVRRTPSATVTGAARSAAAVSTARSSAASRARAESSASGRRMNTGRAPPAASARSAATSAGALGTVNANGATTVSAATEPTSYTGVSDAGRSGTGGT
jgi:hypothetical protein